MATNVVEKIAEGLMSDFNTYNQALVTPLAVEWPDVHFVKPSTDYFRFQLFHNTPFQIAMGGDGVDRYTGILQIDYFELIGQGTLPGTAVVELISERYKRGVDITFESQVIRFISPPEINTPLNGDTHIQFPMRARYQSDG